MIDHEEWDYRYQERLGLLIDGSRPATDAEKEIAEREADEAIRKLNEK